MSRAAVSSSTSPAIWRNSPPPGSSAGVAADEPGGGEFLQIAGDVGGGVFGTQGPQAAGDDRRVVAEPSLVVGLGQQAEEGAFCGDRALGQGLGLERFGL